jgi:hypothetical protein
MNRNLRGLVLIPLAAFASVADATIYTASASAIVRVDTYTQFGSGDVIITLANNSLAASCPYGFWMRGTDAGTKTAAAQMMAAQLADKQVVIAADTSIIWSGSGSAACLVWMVQTL